MKQKDQTIQLVGPKDRLIATVNVEAQYINTNSEDYKNMQLLVVAPDLLELCDAMAAELEFADRMGHTSKYYKTLKVKHAKLVKLIHG